MKFFYLFLFQFLVCAVLNGQTPISRDSVLAIVDTAHTKIEVESQFPGGVAGWINFLKTHLYYPAKAERKKTEGKVWLQFIVETDGSLSDIKAISGPELLLDAALNVIKASPHWIPAMQNGKKVKSYKKQPITFRLQ